MILRFYGRTWTGRDFLWYLHPALEMALDVYTTTWL